MISSILAGIQGTQAKAVIEAIEKITKDSPEVKDFIDELSKTPKVQDLKEKVEMAKKKLEEASKDATKTKVSKKAKQELEKRFKDTTVYLDSNIFMDFNFDNIFDYMIENKVKVTILKSQYDEMINLRKKYKSSKTNQAKTLIPQLTLALNRVEKLLDNTKSNIKDIGFDSDKNAYADVDFIKAILKKLKKDKSVVFVTQDRDLRTRLKTMIKDNKEISKKNINIFKADEFIDYVNVIENIVNDKKEETVKTTNNSNVAGGFGLFSQIFN